ncbi:response regulator [Oceanidesulfovibrio marinus]|uniref:Transcriptional regulatory protein n=1 Tax=Oceanidesulfovibrio marinus TaxID=370038 RepID=A0A6P1ZLK3_9BACT|nr:response regulator [Oceanidesulfovibrio marinus]QJT08741.1 response regulator [Oceanidesulfovibrio marinus]TVM36831.1 two-component system response regulator [Oceanidesulfovibrio marinus]
MKEIRVLIVEDDPRIADLHRRFTERVEGFAVAGIAEGLSDAMDMVDSLQPDLVLLDLYFPEGTSMDLLHHIRGQGMETDVIYITAAKEVAPLRQAMRGGVFDYIIKPVIASRFHESLEKYRWYRSRLSHMDVVEQCTVDSLRPAAKNIGEGKEDLPKGIDALTLEKICAVFHSKDASAGLSAEDVAARVGVSRSTSRRYLEYLVSVDFLVPDVVYGSVGRPERRYFKV